MQLIFEFFRSKKFAFKGETVIPTLRYAFYSFSLNAYRIYGDAMRVIILGGAGFLGKALSNQLAADRSYDVTVFDRAIRRTLRCLASHMWKAHSKRTMTLLH